MVLDVNECQRQNVEEHMNIYHAACCGFLRVSALLKVAQD
jgi:hypothetical protein